MGGTSVARALSILGYKVNQFCQLTSENSDEKYLTEQFNLNFYSDYSLVSNSLEFGKWLLQFIESTERMGLPVILLTRNYSQWESSIEGFVNSDQEFAKKLPKLCEIYDKLLAKSHFDLYKYDVNSGWGPLCGILSKEMPNLPFPKLNKSPENWSI